MKNLIIIGSLCVSVLLLIFSTQGNAYNIIQTKDGKPVHWAITTIPYQIDYDSVPNYLKDSVREIVKDSFQTWQDHSVLRFKFKEGPGRSWIGQIIIVFEEDSWDHPLTLAMTEPIYEVISGKITGSIISINALDITWAISPHRELLGFTSIMGTELPTKYDLQSVIVHEIGHALGLDESDDPESTMFRLILSGGTVKRQLSKDDIAGINFLYNPELSKSGSGCSTNNIIPLPFETLFLFFCFSLMTICHRTGRKRNDLKGP